MVSPKWKKTKAIKRKENYQKKVVLLFFFVLFFFQVMLSPFVPSVRSFSSLVPRRTATATATPGKSKPAKVQAPLKNREDNGNIFAFPNPFCFERFIDSFFNEPFFYEVRVEPEVSAFVKEEKGSYVVKVKLPGFTKDNISVKIGKDDVLCISASSKSVKPQSGEQSFSIVRKFQLPRGSSTRVKEAKGSMQGDTLTISIPKPKPKPKPKVCNYSIPIRYDE